MKTAAPADLGQLRQDIDRIDEAMHALLIERGHVVARVLGAKQQAGNTGSAFRPGREAALMQRLAERHQGPWPLDTAENVWRVIVATSTYLQVPYSVHADLSGGDAAMRDSVRFHFGFTVPYRPADDAADVIKAVDRSAGDLGVFRVDQGASAGAWWQFLHGAGRPKIIARLPFIERPGHPAGLPVYVIAKPLSEGAVREEIVLSLTVERWSARIPALLEGAGARLESSTGTAGGLALLVSLPGASPAEKLLQDFTSQGIPAKIEEIGSHAARFSAQASRA